MHSSFGEERTESDGLSQNDDKSYNKLTFFLWILNQMTGSYDEDFSIFL